VFQTRDAGTADAMTSTRTPAVAVVWPAPAGGGPPPALATTRLAAVADALRRAGVEPVPVTWADEQVAAIESRLCELDGALVWVNPIEHGRGRVVLDGMLRRVADAGVYVSSHPDVIEAIGTKEVLYATRRMGWGVKTALHRSFAEFRARFPESIAAGHVRVLKQRRGNGGQGVWRVEPESRAGSSASPGQVRVREAVRGAIDESLPLATFMDRCAQYFADGGCLIEQAYQSRLAEGTVRCYLVGNRIAGFGEQRVNALLPEDADGSGPPPAGPRLYYPPTRPDFADLKSRVETKWVPELCRLQGVPVAALPVVWDLDFLRGDGGTADDPAAERWVLCEINVSCVFPFPDEALGPLAQYVVARLAERHVRASL
jgi:hypothetical protein